MCRANWAITPYFRDTYNLEDASTLDENRYFNKAPLGIGGLIALVDAKVIGVGVCVVDKYKFNPYSAPSCIVLQSVNHDEWILYPNNYYPTCGLQVFSEVKDVPLPMLDVTDEMKLALQANPIIADILGSYTFSKLLNKEQELKTLPNTSLEYKKVYERFIETGAENVKRFDILLEHALQIKGEEAKNHRQILLTLLLLFYEPRHPARAAYLYRLFRPLSNMKIYADTIRQDIAHTRITNQCVTYPPKLEKLAYIRTAEVVWNLMYQLLSCKFIPLFNWEPVRCYGYFHVPETDATIATTDLAAAIVILSAITNGIGFVACKDKIWYRDNIGLSDYPMAANLHFWFILQKSQTFPKKCLPDADKHRSKRLYNNLLWHARGWLLLYEKAVDHALESIRPLVDNSDEQFPTGKDDDAATLKDIYKHKCMTK